jgi:hypothetical protein
MLEGVASDSGCGFLVWLRSGRARLGGEAAELEG